MKSIRKTLQDAELRLRNKSIESASLDARLILSHILKIKSYDLIARDDQNVSEADQNKFEDLLKRRENLEPIAYILESKEFYGLTFYVDKSVLVPRPETESLVDHILKWIRAHKINSGSILDLGTGSGCILLSLAQQLPPSFQMTGVDISPAALQVAKKNAELLKLKEKIELINADFLNDSGEELKKKYTVIVSNPPYIPTNDVAHLSQDILNYEPLNALDGGKDGIQFYRSLFDKWYGRIQANGLLAVETHGPEQIKTLLMIEPLKTKIQTNKCRVQKDGPHLMIEKLEE